MADSSMEKLFKALVIGGAMLSVSACSTTSPQKPEAKPPAPEAKAPEPAAKAPGCDEICTGPVGRDRVCPDPESGLENCCWLMARLHPCCEEGQPQL